MNEWLKTFVIEELGFTEEEMDAIRRHLGCSLSQEDWESIDYLDADEHEESFHYFKLPTGKMVFLPDDLLYKKTLAEMD